MSRFSIEKDNEYNKTLNENISDENMQKSNIIQITQKILPKSINESNEYNFSKKENLEQYLNDNYKSFSEQFELIDFINQGSYGYVYKIRYKKSINKDIYALKFFYKKKSKEKKK